MLPVFAKQRAVQLHGQRVHLGGKVDGEEALANLEEGMRGHLLSSCRTAPRGCHCKIRHR